MYEDEKIRAAGDLSMRKEGIGPLYFALFRKCEVGILASLRVEMDSLKPTSTHSMDQNDLGSLP